MKIVILTHDKIPISYRLHLGFLKKLRKYCEVKTIISYSKKNIIYMNPKDIYDEYRPDIMILHAHSDIMKGKLKKISCLKIMVSVDFHKKDRIEFYKSNKFDLIVQRGYNTAKIGFPSFWLPFSADVDEFFPYKKKKLKLVGCAATISSAYKLRQDVVNLLKNHNMLNGGTKILGPEYSEFIRRNFANLHTTEINSPHAKIFEIAASNSLILTNNFSTLDLLFPSKGYVVFKDDLSDFKSKVDDIFKNMEKYKEISNLGYSDFINNHTDTIRISELYQNLKNLLEGKEIIKKWGK